MFTKISSFTMQISLHNDNINLFFKTEIQMWGSGKESLKLFESFQHPLSIAPAVKKSKNSELLFLGTKKTMAIFVIQITTGSAL